MSRRSLGHVRGGAEGSGDSMPSAGAETRSHQRRTPRWHEAPRATRDRAGPRDHAWHRGGIAGGGGVSHATGARDNVLHTDEPPTVVQACGAFLAVASGASTPVVRVWEATACGPRHGCMELARHEAEVTALAWGCVAGAWHLASACREEIVRWPVGAALRDGESEVPCHVVANLRGGLPVGAMAYDGSGTLLAVGVGVMVVVYRAQTSDDVLVKLRGHAAQVTALAFCPRTPYHLYSAGEDRMVMVWNLRDRSVAYRSSVLGAHPLRCLAIHPTLDRVAVGSDDGVVRFLGFSPAHGDGGGAVDGDGGTLRCRLLFSFDAARVLRQERQQAHDAAAKVSPRQADAAVVDAMPLWARPQATPRGADATADSVDAAEASTAIMCLQFYDKQPAGAAGGAATRPVGEDDDSFDAEEFVGAAAGRLSPHAAGWRTSSCVCLVATPARLFALDADSYNVAASADTASLPSFAGVPRLAAVFSRRMPDGDGDTYDATCFVLSKYVSRDAWLVPLHRLMSGTGDPLVEPRATSPTSHPHGRVARAVGPGHEPVASSRWSDGSADGGERDSLVDEVGHVAESGAGAGAGAGAAGGGGAGPTRNPRVAANARSGPVEPHGIGALYSAPGPGVAEPRGDHHATPEKVSGSPSFSVFPAHAPGEASPLRARLMRRESGGAEWSGSKRRANKGSGSSRRGGRSGRDAGGSGRGLVDKPVTFHTKVKSSGYGSVPPRNLFGADRKAPTKRRGGRASTGGGRGSLASSRARGGLNVAAPVYPKQPAIPTANVRGPPHALHSEPVLAISYASDGRTVASASTDTTALTFRPPSERGGRWGSSVVAMTGHTGRVRSACFTHGKVQGSSANGRHTPAGRTRSGRRHSDGEHGRRWTLGGDGAGSGDRSGARRASPRSSVGQQLLLTASDDGTARLWCAGSRSAPLLVFRGTVRNEAGGGVKPTGVQRGSHGRPRDGVAYSSASASFTPGHGRRGPSKNPPFPGDINGAEFFYVDKFVVLAAGRNVYMYSYLLDSFEDASNDIRRLQNHCQYRLLRSFDIGCQQVTGLSCINSFLSHLILAAGSDRSVSVLDASCEKVVHRFEDAHPRPVHGVRQPHASSLASLPQDAYNLFLTAATDSSVQMWDLRQCRSVRRFTGHANRKTGTGVAFSPCMNYVASGSEDKMAYVYDIGTSKICERLGGATDAVTDVAWNPRFPQLATACLDGSVRFYRDPAV